MTSKWGGWHDIDGPGSSQLSRFGIYQIRMVSATGNPIPIRRIAGIDKEGVIYIGGSGYGKQSAKKPRTMEKRIEEFEKGPHSGGYTYRLAMEVLQNSGGCPYSAHKLQYRAARLPKADAELVKREEVKSLAGYFAKYAELPPCNSSFPGKWQDFRDRMQEYLRRH
jgi:hypothetical protein